MARLILGRGVLHTPACGDEWGAGRHGGRPLREGVYFGMFAANTGRDDPAPTEMVPKRYTNNHGYCFFIY